MKIKDILKVLERWAPPVYQESYDNSGLITGNRGDEVSSILISLDVTEKVIDEAIGSGANLIIAHHPLIFKGIKKITPHHWVGRCLIKAIKHDIAIYAIHTNLDNVATGVNWKIAQKIGLKNIKILSPKSDALIKLVTFVPTESKDSLLDHLYNAGAGEIGNYDHCSFQLEGTGTFRPNDHANPTIGVKNSDEKVAETRIEVLLSTANQGQVLTALRTGHPYEEVAYYLQPLMNKNQEIGSGAIGTLAEPMEITAFVQQLKSNMKLDVIKSTSLVKQKVQRIAICGGSGSFLLGQAKAKKADVFISADFKYHDFFEAEDDIVIMDIGHYESEVFTKDLIADRLRENFANIALRLSQEVTNPINYL